MPVAAADDSREAWVALVNGGHVALIRHGNAPPSYGDPPGFKIDDCATQSNLDERGRVQARAVGEAFRQHGVRVDKILSSPWCRCLETPRLMALGPVDNTWAAAASDKSRDRLAALKQMVSNWRGGHITAGRAFGDVTFYYVTMLKNGRTEIFDDQPQMEVCIHALFPHAGYRPRWYAVRRCVRTIS